PGLEGTGIPRAGGRCPGGSELRHHGAVECAHPAPVRRAGGEFLGGRRTVGAEPAAVRRISRRAAWLATPGLARALGADVARGAGALSRWLPALEGDDPGGAGRIPPRIFG